MIKRKNILLLTLISVLLIGSCLTVNAAPVLMPDGTFFDAEYYAQTNPDVVGVLGTDATILYNHYVNSGKAEGRAPYNPALDISTLIDTATYAAAIDATLRDTDSSYLELKTALPGSYITFGTYEQDNNKKNGQEPIEWLVLENDGESLFVLSKYVLDGQPYSTAYDQFAYNPYPVTWETCSLRTWLNSTFLTAAFNEGEQARIETSLLDNSIPQERSMNYDTLTGGSDTLDKIFILSYSEIQKYFPTWEKLYYESGSYTQYNRAIRVQPTAYALAQGADIWTQKEAATAKESLSSLRQEAIGYTEQVAVRTPSSLQTTIITITPFGSLGEGTVTYDTSNRPAMRISIK